MSAKQTVTSQKQSGVQRQSRVDPTRKAAGLYYYVLQGDPLEGFETLEKIAAAFHRMPMTVQAKCEELMKSENGIEQLKHYALVAVGYQRHKYDGGQDEENMRKALAELHHYRITKSKAEADGRSGRDAVKHLRGPRAIAREFDILPRTLQRKYRKMFDNPHKTAAQKALHTLQMNQLLSDATDMLKTRTHQHLHQCL
ncbi:hypothetical protein OAM67_00310 [bacterium]|nr:hypothetical protein [bacterium]